MAMPNHYREAKRIFDVEYFSTLQQLHQRNMTRIAETAGMNRTQLYKKMKKLGLIESRAK